MQTKIVNPLKEFKFHSILKEHSHTKEAFVVICDPKHKNEKIDAIKPDSKAILILRKPNFLMTDWFPLNKFKILEKYFESDVYSKHNVSNKSELVNCSQMELIYPASDFLINKYSFKKIIQIEETPEMYLNLKKNMIEKLDKNNSKWIENLFLKNSKEEILFKNNDFVIVWDYKFKFKTDPKHNFHGLVIFKDEELKSLRDLTKSHKENIVFSKIKAIELIKDKLDFKSEKVIMYFHYLPTFWRLHIHFSHVDHFFPTTIPFRYHSINQVISNLNFENFYSTSTLQVQCPSHLVKNYNKSE